jgi:hypothetical protein
LLNGCFIKATLRKNYLFLGAIPAFPSILIYSPCFSKAFKELLAVALVYLEKTAASCIRNSIAVRARGFGVYSNYFNFKTEYISRSVAIKTIIESYKLLTTKLITHTIVGGYF